MGTMEENRESKFHFGPLLARIRMARGLSRRALELASSVPDSYIALMEKGERPPPSAKALYALTDALGCTNEERLLLFERALGDRILKEVYAYAGYLFLSLASDEDAERAASAISRVWQEMDATEVREQLEMIASGTETKYVRMREQQAEQIFSRLTIYPAAGEVSARLGQFAASALNASALHDPDARVQASAEEEDA